MVKCLPTMRETWVQSLGREDLLEKEMATHTSILAWKMSYLKHQWFPHCTRSCFMFDFSKLTLVTMILPFFGIGMKINIFQSCGHC